MKVKNIFIKETSDNLAVLEHELAQANQLSHDAIMMVVRTMHNIKGTAPMVGFNELPDIAIPIEQAYKEVLNNNLAINSSMVEKTKSAVYILQQMLIEEETHTVHSEEEKSVLIDYFNAING